MRQHRLPILFSVSLITLGAAHAAAQPFNGFAALPAVPTGNFPTGVGLADFDSDGDLDAAVSVWVATTGPGQVRILINNGRGIMVPGPTITLGVRPGRLVIADMNNDGRADIVVPNTNSGTVCVIRSNGNGTFQAPAFHAVAASTESIAVADFDGNGFMDIAAASSTTNEMRILLGNGAGFPTVRSFFTNLGPTLGVGPRSIAAGDLNGDGLADIVSANEQSEDFSIYFGSGNGFFFSGEFAYYIAQPDLPYEVELADMDNDGDKDIVIARGLTNAEVSWYRNRYDGGLEIFPNFNDGSWTTAVGGRLVDLATARLDCNNDAFPDVLGANEADGDALNVLINPGAGALSLRASPPVPGLSPEGVAAGDLDGDGDADAIVCNFLSDDVRVYLNRCAGRNCPADLNGDGLLNFFDVSAYIAAYNAGSPSADLASPAGSFNFFDVSAFISLYNAGCP
jgi:hypothetical protein